MNDDTPGRIFAIVVLSALAGWQLLALCLLSAYWLLPNCTTSSAGCVPAKVTEVSSHSYDTDDEGHRGTITVHTIKFKTDAGAVVETSKSDDVMFPGFQFGNEIDQASVSQDDTVLLRRFHDQYVAFVPTRHPGEVINFDQWSPGGLLMTVLGVLLLETVPAVYLLRSYGKVKAEWWQKSGASAFIVVGVTAVILMSGAIPHAGYMFNVFFQ